MRRRQGTCSVRFAPWRAAPTRHVVFHTVRRCSVAGRSAGWRPGEDEWIQIAAVCEIALGHDQRESFPFVFDGERLQALLRDKGRGDGSRRRRSGAIQMERQTPDQGGSSDRAYQDAGRSECRGEQQTKQTDATGAGARS